MPATVAIPTTSSASKLAYQAVFSGLLLIVAGLLLSILILNHGVFTYTLDDPYIHLALSDHILHGHYGINASEPSAPSSSILFPFLLAPFAGTALHPFVPIILDIAALFVSVDLMRRFFLRLRLAETGRAAVVLPGLLMLLVLCCNMVGVAFTGLEHSLHIAATIGIIYGLAVFLEKDKLPAWLPVLIVLGPLLRYEGVALSMAAITVLALRGSWRAALVSFTVLVACVAGFSIFLVKHGLPPLPSSILVKSALVSTSKVALLRSLNQNAHNMEANPIGLLLLLIAVGAFVCCLRALPAPPWRWKPRGLMAFVLVCLVLAHALAGSFAGFWRYELYVMVGTALLGIYVIQDQVRNVFANPRLPAAFVIGIALALLVAGRDYALATAYVPLEANNIYEQQMQMHRFVVGFLRGPVAVNDLGLVSYHNPYFVLDLWGLGSEKARVLRLRQPPDPAAYDALVHANGVHLAMIFDEWFPDQIPDTWTKVATLQLSRTKLTPVSNQVQFYATDEASLPALHEKLMAFQKALPPRVVLHVY